MPSKTTTVLGGDFGNGNSKVTGPTGSTVIQTMVASGGTAAYDAEGISGSFIGVKTLTPAQRVDYDNLCFFVGANAHYQGHSLENFNFDRMSGTPEMRALVYGTLSEHFKGGPMPESITLIIGLPFQSSPIEEQKAIVEKARRWMKGEHKWFANGNPFAVNIEEVHATSQASGALFDYLFDDSGKIIPEHDEAYQGQIGVISLGFGTIEMMACTERRAVQKWTKSQPVGMRRVLELSNQDEHYTLAQLDAKLRSGRLDVKALIPIWEREVTNVIEKYWGTSWKMFSQVVIVGGGATLIGDTLERYFRGKAMILNDPVIAISRGLYKKALNTLARQGQSER